MPYTLKLLKVEALRLPIFGASRIVAASCSVLDWELLGLASSFDEGQETQ